MNNLFFFQYSISGSHGEVRMVNIISLWETRYRKCGKEGVLGGFLFAFFYALGMGNDNNV